MAYIVLDIEANKGGKSEIIQLAALKIDEGYSIIDSFNFYVKPKINPKLQWHIKRLTGIEQEKVDNADMFPIVFEKFLAWAGEDPTFVTWSNSDQHFIQTEFEIHGIVSDILSKFLNIQNAFCSLYQTENLVSLTHAIELIGSVFEGRKHNAYDDAKNTSNLFLHLVKKLGGVDKIQKEEFIIKKKNSFDSYIRYKEVGKTINQERYRNYLGKLSIEELKEKENVFEKIMRSEVEKSEDVTSLYALVWRKRKALKSVLRYKEKEVSLQSSGLEREELELLKKSSNILYSIRFKLLKKTTVESKKLLDKLVRDISEIRGYARKINKNKITDIKKERVYESYHKLYEIIKIALNSGEIDEKHEITVKMLEQKVRNHIQKISCEHIKTSA